MAMADTAGYTNTLNIRTAQNQNPLYAAGVINFPHGWYLPSAAQLRLIYAQFPFIENALLSAGGSLMNEDYYWSSTQYVSDSAWAINFHRTLHPCWMQKLEKSALCRVRAVCSFHYDTLSYAWSNGSTEPVITVAPTQTTTYTAVAISPYGCTDTIRTSIVVLNRDTTNLVVSACDSYVWDDSVITTSGDYERHYTSNAGCDSVVILHLTINHPASYTFNDTILENNLPYTLNGIDYDTTGTYVQLLTTVGGCDSTLTLNLTVLYNVQTNVDSVLCPHELPLLWNGVTFTDAGTQDAVLTAANGADSVVTMTLTLKPSPQAVINGSPFMCADSSVVLTADSAYSYLWSSGATIDSILVSTEGYYGLTVTNEYGCIDTVGRSVLVAILDPIIAFDIGNICAGGIYNITIGYQNTANIQFAHDPSLPNSRPMVLTVADGPWIQSSTDNSFLISPPSSLDHDTIVTYHIYFYDDYGCSYDTIITLPVYLSDSATVDITVLENDLPLVMNGQSYTTPNTYVQNLSTVHGCDSTLTINMTVLNNVQTSVDSAVCEEELPLHWNGKTFNGPGTQSVVLTAANGVDSTVVMTVSLYPSPQAHINGSPYMCDDNSLVLTADSCYAYLWSTGSTVDSAIVTSQGTYFLTVTNEYGCSDYASHTVLVSELDPLVSITNSDLCAGDSYLFVAGYSDAANAQFSHGVSTLDIADTIFLPDGVSCEPYGCSYRSPVTFSDFAPGSSIQNVNDILYVRLNMEHSYIGDLYINITCPNGQKAHILRYGGIGTSYCNNSVPTGGTGWQSGNNMNRWTFLGQANDNASTFYKCDPTILSNAPGIGWNYCWSNNTTEGYGYAPGAGSLVYRAANAHNGIVDSSNVAAGTHFYHPDQSFSNLIGCPLNGSWYIEVVDAWSGDNGYIFGWELALDPSLLPQSSNPITMMTGEGPWINSVNDTSFVITPPDTLEHDSLASYILHFYDDYGCSYDTTFTLSVFALTSNTIDTTVLENNLPLVMNGHSMNTAGTYQQVLSNHNGCDSNVTINVTVLYNVQFAADTSVCLEELPLHWNGKIFTAAGTQNAVLTAANGVDSTVVMTVSIIPATSYTITAAIVQNNLPYTLNGYSYNSSGTYTQHLTNAAGCDSVVTLVLTVYQNVSHTIDTIVCAANMPYTWHGLTFTAEGTQNVVLTSSTGADSTLYCHLTVDAPTATIGNVTHVLCYGASTGAATSTVTGAQSPLTYQWTNASGTSVSTTANLSDQPAGTYNLLVTDHLGCTSTATVTLNTESDPLQPGTIADNQDVCIDGDVATFTGDVASGGDNGVYQWQLSSDGANWNQAPGVNNSQNYTYPDPAIESFALRRAWISQSCGTAYSDSVTVTVWLNYQDTVTAIVCQNEPYQENGFDITADETANTGEFFFENLLSTGHCDSLVVLKLTVNPVYEVDIDDEVCEGRPYNKNGFDIPVAETLESELIQRSTTFQSVSGCDSVVNLSLSVIDTALEIISSTDDFCEDLYAELTAVSEMTNYVWNTGDQTQQIEVRQSGTYSVVASHGECSVSAQYIIESCDVRLYLPNAITPSNGDGVNDYFSIPERTQFLIDEFEITIYNRWGELIFFSTDKNFHWDGTVRDRLYRDNVYTYVIRCTNVSGRPYLYKGSITVL